MIQHPHIQKEKEKNTSPQHKTPPSSSSSSSPHSNLLEVFLIPRAVRVVDHPLRHYISSHHNSWRHFNKNASPSLSPTHPTKPSNYKPTPQSRTPNFHSRTSPQTSFQKLSLTNKHQIQGSPPKPNPSQLRSLLHPRSRASRVPSQVPTIALANVSRVRRVFLSPNSSMHACMITLLDIGPLNGPLISSLGFMCLS